MSAWLPPLKVGHGGLLIQPLSDQLDYSILFLVYTIVGPLCLAKCPSLNSTRLGSIFLSKLDHNTFSMVCTLYMSHIVYMVTAVTPNEEEPITLRTKLFQLVIVWHQYSLMGSVTYYLVVCMYEPALYCHYMTPYSMNTIHLRKQLSKYGKAMRGWQYVYLRTIPKTFVRGLLTQLKVTWLRKLSMDLQSTFTWMSQVWNSKSDHIAVCFTMFINDDDHTQRCYVV